ncbi:hypothetical protein DES45_11346 [Microvirga subterranea]|uniref:Uncharacterized protein n=1 Tax=Microvirga subterranea TaxID=186651 RepID=A0A370HAK5_9HYPH|nr:hypothetical protein DES45_11346 [Microvirga subterranea]
MRLSTSVRYACGSTPHILRVTTSEVMIASEPAAFQVPSKHTIWRVAGDLWER